MLRFKKVMGLVIATSIVSVSAVGISPLQAATNAKTSVTAKKVVVKPDNLNKVGATYGSKTASKPLVYNGDVNITAKNVKLNNAVIKGNLYITGKSVTLKNVTVAKTLTVAGATVTITGNISRLEVKKTSTLTLLKGTKISNLVAMSNVNLITNLGSRIVNLHTKGHVVTKSGLGIISSHVGYITGNQTAKPVIVMKSITLDKTTATLNSGEKVTLTATIDPKNPTNKTLLWSSSNTAIATVDDNGVVTANANGTAGTAVIKVTNKNGAVSATCTVTVNPVAVTGITSIITSTGSTDVTIGNTIVLTANVAPANATNKAVTWTSSDSTVATVTSTGDTTANVAALKLGTVTMTAATKDGNKVAAITLTVKPVIVSSVSLDKSSYTFVLGDAAQKLTATVSPANATDKNLTWTSSNTSVATVDPDGTVKAVGFGKATITVASVADPTKTATFDVTVNIINNSDAYGDNTLPTIAFTVIVTPTNGIDSSNVSVDYTLANGNKNTKAADAGLTNGKITVSIPEDITTVTSINLNITKNGYTQTISLDPSTIK